MAGTEKKSCCFFYPKPKSSQKLMKHHRVKCPAAVQHFSHRLNNSSSNNNNNSNNNNSRSNISTKLKTPQVVWKWKQVRNCCKVFCPDWANCSAFSCFLQLSGSSKYNPPDPVGSNKVQKCIQAWIKHLKGDRDCNLTVTKLEGLMIPFVTEDFSASYI